MALDYAGLAGIATGLIAEAGQAMTLKIGSTAAYDPSQDTPTASTNLSVTGVTTSYTLREVDGNMIRRNDVKVILSTKGVTTVPTVADRLTIGGVDYAIVNVDILSPAGTAVIYTVQARA